MIRRRFLLGAAASPWFAGAGRATPPGDAITLLVGAAADSPEDHAARAFAPFLARHLPGARIALANLADDGGLAAVQALREAAPDGRTLLWATTPTLPALSLAADDGPMLDRITLLAAIRKEPVAFVSPAISGLASIRDLVAAADSRGPALPLATPPAGSPAHLATLRLQELSRIPLAVVPFSSACAARLAARAGTACAAALALSDAIDDLRQQHLVGLGITATDRSDVFPAIAPAGDAGLGLRVSILHGLAAPLDLPEPTGRRLLDALHEVADDPEFRAEADTDGFQIGWVETAAWTTQARAERDELQTLWPSAAHRTLEAATLLH